MLRVARQTVWTLRSEGSKLAAHVNRQSLLLRPAVVAAGGLACLQLGQTACPAFQIFARMPEQLVHLSDNQTARISWEADVLVTRAAPTATGVGAAAARHCRPCRSSNASRLVTMHLHFELLNHRCAEELTGSANYGLARLAEHTAALAGHLPPSDVGRAQLGQLTGLVCGNRLGWPRGHQCIVCRECCCSCKVPFAPELASQHCANRPYPGLASQHAAGMFVHLGSPSFGRGLPPNRRFSQPGR